LADDLAYSSLLALASDCHPRRALIIGPEFRVLGILVCRSAFRLLLTFRPKLANESPMRKGFLTQSCLIRPRLVVGIQADFPRIALKNQIRCKVTVKVFSATVRLLDSITPCSDRTYLVANCNYPIDSNDLVFDMPSMKVVICEPSRSHGDHKMFPVASLRLHPR